MQVPEPQPYGRPMQLPADVSGALSRIQGLLQAAAPQIQDAYAAHWLALRQAGFVPEFQQATQQLLWALYSTTALSGLVGHALSGRAYPDLMGAIIDQLHLLNESHRRAADLMNRFLHRPDVTGFPYVRPMVEAFRPLLHLLDQLRQPADTVIRGIRWIPGPMLDMPGIVRADLEMRR